MRASFLLAASLASLALAAIAVRLAWIGDDAWITLRTVEHLARGDGMRWNAVDRVQTFTHPLWLLLLAAGRVVTGEVYVTTIAVSLLASTAAILLLFASARTAAAVIALAIVLAGTRAFVDFTSSGLETPLTTCLLVAFVRVATSERPPARRFGAAVLLASLLATTRLDLVLLVGPTALAQARGVPWRAAVWQLVVASAPLWAWLVFATIWFGHPLPVTAHSKLFDVGMPSATLVAQGGFYVWFALVDDPLLVVGTVAGLGAGIANARTRWLAAGMVLYVGYVVRIGGDFMAGRMLLPPFVVAIALLAGWLGASGPRRSVLVALLAIVGIVVRGTPAWLVAPSVEEPPSVAELVANRGICDERRFYARRLGFFGPEREVPHFDCAPHRGPASERWFWVMGTAGVAGYRAGRRGHLIDPLVCDPLLSRLPTIDPANWRPGHARRRVPEGYVASLLHGDNRIVHAGLRRYYEALRTVTQAPVFDGHRLATMWRLLWGDFDADLRAFVAEDYHTPPRAGVPFAALPPKLPCGTLWHDAPQLQFIGEGGVAVALDAAAIERAAGARTLCIQTVGLYSLTIRFVRQGEVVGQCAAAARPANGDPWRVLAGLHATAVAMPTSLGRFDTLWIDAAGVGPGHATGPAAVGAITFVR